MYWVKKRLVWVVLDRGDRCKDNETGLKEGGGIEISTTVLPLRDARSLRLNTHQQFTSSFVTDCIDCSTNTFAFWFYFFQSFLF